MTVLVEIDVGAARCGVPAGPAAVELAKQIAASPHLIFGGLQAYQGSAQHKRTVAERQTLIGTAIDAARRTVEQLRQQGLDCPIVGGGGTGTFQIESHSGIYTEIQCGSYVFMDADYARNLDAAGKPVSTFRHALFVLATVMSAPHTGSRGAGRGSQSGPRSISGMPTVWRKPDIRYVSASDEHGKLDVGSETTMPKLGEKLRLVPGHCDPDRRSLRLVCRRARRPRGESVAGGGPRRHGLTRQSGHSRRFRSLPAPYRSPARTPALSPAAAIAHLRADQVTPTGSPVGPKQTGIPTLGPCISVHIRLNTASPVVCSPSGASPLANSASGSHPAPGRTSRPAPAGTDPPERKPPAIASRVICSTFSTRSFSVVASSALALTYSRQERCSAFAFGDHGVRGMQSGKWFRQFQFLNDRPGIAAIVSPRVRQAPVRRRVRSPATPDCGTVPRADP